MNVLKKDSCYIDGLGLTRKEQLQKFRHQEQEQKAAAEVVGVLLQLVQLQVARMAGVRSNIHNIWKTLTGGGGGGGGGGGAATSSGSSLWASA